MYIVIKIYSSHPKLHNMRSYLFVFILIMALAVTSCSDSYTRTNEVAKVVKAAQDKVPPLDYKAMVAYYNSLPPGDRKITERVSLSYEEISSMIQVMPTFGYNYTLTQGLFDKDNAAKYATFYSTASMTITPEEIIDKPALLLLFVKKTDTAYMLLGKVCPPPPNCDLY